MITSKSHLRPVHSVRHARLRISPAILALALSTACANVSLDEEADQNLGGASGDGDSNAGSTTGAGGAIVTGSGGVILVGSGGATSGGASTGGSATGGSSSGGSAAGGSASGGTSSGGSGAGGTASGGAASGGAASGGSGTGGFDGSCDSPSVGSYTQAACGDTIEHGGNLYTCISQKSGVNGEASGCGDPTVRCSEFTPDHAGWGGATWSLVTCN